GWSSTLRFVSLIVTARMRLGGTLRQRLRQDRDQGPVREVAPRLLSRVVRQLDAPQALRRPIRGARDVVDGVAPDEVRYALHEIRVVRSVRIGAPHGLAPEALVHGKGSRRRAPAVDAGVGGASEDDAAVVVHGEALRPAFGGHGVVVAGGVELAVEAGG